METGNTNGGNEGGVLRGSDQSRGWCFIFVRDDRKKKKTGGDLKFCR